MAFYCLKEWVTSLVNNNCNIIPDIWCAHNFVSFLYEAISPKLWININHFPISRIGVRGHFLHLFSMVAVSWYPIDKLSGHRNYLHSSSDFNCPLYIKISDNRSLQPGYWIWFQYIFTHLKYWRSDYCFLFYCCIFSQIRPQPAWLGRRLEHVEFKGKIYISKRWQMEKYFFEFVIMDQSWLSFNGSPEHCQDMGLFRHWIYYRTNFSRGTIHLFHGRTINKFTFRYS